MQGLEVEDRGRASEDDKEIAKQSGNEIYIGFDKADSTPRKGRKGRLVTDDPKRYPDRDALSGGWAGGEVGLQEFVKVRHFCFIGSRKSLAYCIHLMLLIYVNCEARL